MGHFGETIWQLISKKWRDRTLMEIKKDKFCALWTHQDSYPWTTLNGDEKSRLSALVLEHRQKEEGLWKKQAQEILSALTKSVQMVPCGEDLGVNLQSVPEVMGKNKILRLNVVRWSRHWEREGSPYFDSSEYPELSVTTTSVHDSSTIREWWTQEKESASTFFWANKDVFEANGISESGCGDFTEKTALSILQAAARCKSLWVIHPIQDFLYLQKKHWLPNPQDERVNVPGQVSDFNWTYRMSASVEDLSADKELCERIKGVANR